LFIDALLILYVMSVNECANVQLSPFYLGVTFFTLAMIKNFSSLLAEIDALNRAAKNHRG
jgi:hypothetical protein